MIEPRILDQSKHEDVDTFHHLVKTYGRSFTKSEENLADIIDCIDDNGEPFFITQFASNLRYVFICPDA
jgi:hypothetical protein